VLCGLEQRAAAIAPRRLNDRTIHPTGGGIRPIANQRSALRPCAFG
jgi:hypothetical protein